jgi:hypothetical protein
MRNTSFDVRGSASVVQGPTVAIRRSPADRERRISLPLRMDDGQVKTVELPAALQDPAQFSTAEFERLTRAYAEALGLLG